MKFRPPEIALRGALGRELRSYEKERDPEIYFRGLLNLGQRLVERDELSSALQLFHFIQSEAADTLPNLAQRAEREIDAIEGRGALGGRAEFLGRRFFRETEPSSLIGMAGAQAVFGLARATFLFRLRSFPASNLFTRGIGARSLASAGAFALEVPGFVAFHHAANAALGNNPDSGPSALGHEVAGSFLTLGALKLMGAAARTLRPQNAALAQSAMFGGILLGHQLEEKAGLRAPTDDANALIDSFATLLQFNLAGRMLNGGLGKAWVDFNRNLHWRSEKIEPPRFNSPEWASQSLALASGSPFAKPRPNQHFLLSESKEDIFFGLSDAPASVKKIAGEILEMEPGQSPLRYRYLLACSLLQKARTWLSPGEITFLKSFAHRLLDGPSGKDEYPTAFKIFRQILDFPGIQRVAEGFGGELTKNEAYIALENYEKAFEVMPERDLKNLMTMPETAFPGIGSAVSERLAEFGFRKGYPEFSYQGIGATFLNLAQLAKSYDLVISIAKGGLYSGAVADFLGIPVRVVEIHAHDREFAISKFVDEIKPEDLAGKRVLLVDKDAVSGNSIREALRLFKPFQPKSIGVYFNQEAGEVIPTATVEALRHEGIEIHLPRSTPGAPALSVFYEIHEKLGTPLGRFQKNLRGFEEELQGEEVVREFIARQRQAFFAFNQFLPGVAEIRAAMATRLETLLKSYRDARVIDANQARKNLLSIMKLDPGLPMEYAGTLAEARYVEAGRSHYPHSYLAAFAAAQRAMNYKYQVVLIVGPEGFAYEPIFLDLGAQRILRVNIPEAGYDGSRSFQSLGNLAELKGKSVLVVEDDVQSGATLRKLLKEIGPYQPRFLGLYLGSSPDFQFKHNIPEAFQKIHQTEPKSGDEETFLKRLKKREVVFKNRPPRAKK